MFTLGIWAFPMSSSSDNSVAAVFEELGAAEPVDYPSWLVDSGGGGGGGTCEDPESPRDPEAPDGPAGGGGGGG
nr:hypothetical protein [Tanacetum cinerariifolium]